MWKSMHQSLFLNKNMKSLIANEKIFIYVKIIICYILGPHRVPVNKLHIKNLPRSPFILFKSISVG